MRMRFIYIIPLMLLCLLAQAQFKFEEGKQYTVIAETKTAQPEVKEFFSLFCGHCFQFEPFMDSLQAALPNGLKLEKSHVSYMPQNDPEMQQTIVKAFLTMREMGKEKELVRQFFAAYHVQGVEFETQEDIKKIFEANDISGAQFDQMMASAGIASKAKAMSALWEEKEIASVPTIVVNGKYRINMGTLKSLDEMKAITLELLSKD